MRISLFILCILFSQAALSQLHGFKKSIIPKKNLVHKVNTFGTNDKVYTTTTEFWKVYIGKIFTPAGYACTASLVGKNLILTAAHCLTNKEKTELQTGDYEFQLGYDNGSFVASSKIASFLYGEVPVKESRHDWAILQLTEPLGEKYGYFGSKSIPSAQSDLNFNLLQAGYGVEFEEGERLTINYDCRIRRHSGYVLLHDCDVSGGDSGAPIFKCEDSGCYILAMHVGARTGEFEGNYVERQVYSTEYANVAVSGEMFVNEIYKLQNN